MTQDYDHDDSWELTNPGDEQRALGPGALSVVGTCHGRGKSQLPVGLEV